MTRAEALAKINLALVVGPRRPDGKHEVATVLQRVDLADTIELEPARTLRVEGFADDTLVRDALTGLAATAGVDPRWSVRIEKRIPVAAGLGGGSSDAAAALGLANATLDEPVRHDALHELARSLGADVPFFLEAGPQLGTGDGSTLAPVDVPQDYVCVLVLPAGVEKESTAAVYARFDESGRVAEFEGRRALLDRALAARDLTALPSNDLARSPCAAELLAMGAFRADVTGAGPAVYGLFRDGPDAARAAAALEVHGRVWVARPAW
jgi:4-diphosphocytidyl-2-C-methyl-D-erythritol kinase